MKIIAIRVVEQSKIPVFFGVIFLDAEIHFCFDPKMPLKLNLIQKYIFAFI